MTALCNDLTTLSGTNSDFVSRDRQMLIGGAWVNSSVGATFAVRDPSSGEELTRVQKASVQDVAAASNEHGAAKKFTTRYFMYRVFVKRGPPLSYELAVLKDPVHSKAVRHIERFDLSEGSGADWFACTNVSDDEGEE